MDSDQGLHIMLFAVIALKMKRNKEKFGSKTYTNPLNVSDALLEK